MEFSLHQLKIFVTVANTLNFSRAAEQLILTQPAVSMQIKALERSLGMHVFDHIGKRIQLTQAGRELYAWSVQILGMAKSASEAMDDLHHSRAGRLRVVATTTVGIYVVPALLGEFHKRHPGVEIKLEVANWERTCDCLFAGEADIALAGPHPSSGLRMEPFMDDQLVVIAAPDHPLVGRTHIALEQLAREPMIVREEGSGTRALIEKLFAEQRLPLRRVMELNRNGAVKQAVKAGLGLAVISRAALGLELENGTLRILDVENFPIVRAWNIITRAGFALPPSAQMFVKEIRQGVSSEAAPSLPVPTARSSLQNFE